MHVLQSHHGNMCLFGVRPPGSFNWLVYLCTLFNLVVTHVSLITVLNYNPCRVPLKYRFPIDKSDHIRPTYSNTQTFVQVLGPLHTRAKSRDLVMVRTLDSHPKAVPWVLGKPF